MGQRPIGAGAARIAVVQLIVGVLLLTGPAWAMQAAAAVKCGNTGSGFSTWKKAFAREAKSAGFQGRAINALLKTSYMTGTIAADRGQKSFKLSLSSFLQKRGGDAIASRGRKLKRQNAALLASIEKRYGVPPGPLLAIWGMETGFGGTMGNQNVLSAIATLAYDCRRPEYFTDHLHAALTLIDNGTLSPSAKGAMHGEVGQTQFLPKNILLYGADGDGDGTVDLMSKADALVSTANFLSSHGWVAGDGYQPGEPNFVAIQGWNSASVYQRAIALIGSRIDAP
jgi:lytic murein transglycosylase